MGLIYKEHKISIKHFKTEKLPPTLNLITYFSKVNTCKQQMIDAAARGLPIVYIDQTLFTRHTIQRTTYSRKYQHYRLDTPS